MSKQINASAPRIVTSTPQTTHETLAVIGLGYVGLPLAIRAAEKGFPVVGFDIDAAKIAAIRSGTLTHLTPRERATLANTRTLTATNDAHELARARTFIICVPTPVSHTREPDLRPLEGACRTVAAYLKRGDLVVIESTVNPGVCEGVVLPILERRGLTVEKDFYLAHCPERINPGDARWDVRTIPRVVGGAGEESLLRAVSLYRSIID